MNDQPSTSDPWGALRRLTAARIAVGRSGGSLPTREVLDFRLAHARARDAVLSPFAPESLAADLRKFGTPVVVAESAARDRAEFLQRPDAGRRLSEASRVELSALTAHTPPVDLVIIASDGLSALAAMTQIAPLLAGLLPCLGGAGWQLAPLIIARHARVALQDEIGQLFRARLSLMLLGERPGLGSADSLGAYFTHAPAPGRTDADRNCVSNIRAGGLPPMEAAHKLFHLLGESRRLALSGVALKDSTPPLLPPA